MAERMTMADATLINAVGALVTSRTAFDPDEQEMLIDCMEECMNSANWNNPHMLPLVTAARTISKKCLNKRENIYHTLPVEACELQGILCQVLRWRLGESLEAWRTRRVAA